MFTGGWIICCSVAMVDLFGIDKVVKCYGVMTVAHAISFLSSSIVHGKRAIQVITARVRRMGKVMFAQACVCPQGLGGGTLLTGPWFFPGVP